MSTRGTKLTTDSDIRLQEMRGVLEAGGVILTPRRSRLLEVLVASDHHPTVGELHREVRRSFPKTSLATIYNTIELLKKAGQVLEIEFSGAANRYDGRRPKPHPHLVCIRCERIDDMDQIGHEESFDDISAATGYEIVSYRSEYFGICPDCSSDTEGAD